MSTKRSVLYKGTEYDITDFISDHPGGKQIIEAYLKTGNTITEVFKSLHSKEAEKKLMSLAVIGKVQRSKHEKFYLKIQERVSRLYEASYALQIITVFVIISLYAMAFLMNHTLITIFAFALCEIMTAWTAHSQLHFHHSKLNSVGKMLGGVIMGLSCKWWKKKHLQHHIFTNNELMDDDIKHNYRTILYPFLLLKWRIQSIWTCLRFFQLSQISFIALGYYLLYRQKVVLFVLGELIASFYICTVFFGNHEREKKYREHHLDHFLTHQLTTTVDYDFASDLMLGLFGGFQYHTEHHLFPQIPFYNLKEAKKIIGEELLMIKKQVIVSSVF